MMDDRRRRACILNYGASAWAFEDLARQLADGLGVDVAMSPRAYNYVLGAERDDLPGPNALFIDVDTIELAGDKRRLAVAFRAGGVPTPETHLIPDLNAARAFVRGHDDREWCLKYPIGSGASGHRLFASDMEVPKEWPAPYVVQEFIRLERPEVYRVYAAGGQLFGWLVRRYDDGRGSPWVAHARGAHWETLSQIPPEVAAPAQAAFVATHLFDTFGCADLLRRPNGDWVVLEVGTDGLFNHVDRDLGDPTFEQELLARIRDSFWLRFSRLQRGGA